MTFSDVPLSFSQILIYVAYPVAKPVSLLLEKILGSHNGIIYRKAELRELVRPDLQFSTRRVARLTYFPSLSSTSTPWLECTVVTS